jgi:hypothetical protein
MGLIAGTSTSNVNITAPGTTATAPTPSIAGALRYNTTTNTLQAFIGGVWVNVS